MRRVIAIAGVAVAALAMAALDAGSRAAAQTGENRAVVVVELPSGERRSACVVFTQPSITGLDLLRAAQMQPETYGFGQGQAVCKLCGEGCPVSRGDCLSCNGGKYWQYYRSDGGGPYVYSGTGASSSSVTDGDVDGWSFDSARKTPLLVAVETVCSDPARTFRFEGSSSPPPSTATTTAPAPSTTAPSPGSSAPTTAPAPPPGATGSAAAGSRSVTTLPPLAAPTTSTSTAPAAATDAGVEPTTTSTTPLTGVAAGSGGRRTPSSGPARAADGSSLPAYVAFGLVMATIVGATIRASRRRHRPA